jgi:hypothetical protein
MKQLKDEGGDLWLRTKKLFKTIALSVILLLQVSIQTGILFFTIWITVFTKGKKLADRTTTKVSDKMHIPLTLLQKEN